MRAALDDLATHETAGRRIAVLGDMLELGPAEDEHHRDVGAYAATAGVDVLVTVGAAGREDARPLRRRGLRGRPTRPRRRRWPASWSAPGDVLLVKGSRGVGLEVVAEALAAGESPADGRGPDRRARPRC